MDSERLPRLTPDMLDEEQAGLYESIAGGDRAKGVQHFPLTDDNGALHGPFGVMLHAPGVGWPLQELGATIRYRTDLTPRIREVAILQVAHATGSRFEWWAHERVGRALGLTDEEIMALSIGCFTSDDPLEAASARLCENLLSSSVLTDDEYAALAQDLSRRQIVELTVLVGYYRTLAQLMSVFDVGVPGEKDAPSQHGHHHAH